MQGTVADRLVAAARDALLKLDDRATDDQALVEFDFDAMVDGAIGALAVAEVPAIADWLSRVPVDDWPIRFNGDEQIMEKARFYATRLNFSDGRQLTLFRGSRGLNVILKGKGGVAAAFSRDRNEMVALDGAVVSFDSEIDFFFWQGMVFVANFRTFESVTNIREETIRKSGEAMDALAARFGLGGNPEGLKLEIGKRALLAKKLAAAHRHGIIADIDPNKLVDRATHKGLRLRFRTENGNLHFDIDHNNRDEVQDFVDLLTDVFLQSPVTGREWEAVVKRIPKVRTQI